MRGLQMFAVVIVLGWVLLSLPSLVEARDPISRIPSDRFTEPTLLANMDATWDKSIAIGNMDTDPEPEILVATSRTGGNVQIHTFDHQEGVYHQSIMDTKLMLHEKALLGIEDINQDGHNDVVVFCGNQYQVWWSGRADKYLFGTVADVAADALAVFPGGLAVTSWPRSVLVHLAVFRFDPNRNELKVTRMYSHPAGDNRIVFGDVNGDGLGDLVVMWGQGQNPVFSVYAGLPGGGFDQPVDYQRDRPWYGLPRAIYLVDLSAPGPGEGRVQDGLLDVVIAYGGNDSAIHTFIQEGDHLKPSWFREIPPGVVGMSFIDLTCDGQDELVIVNNYSISWLEDSTGQWYQEDIGPLPYWLDQDEFMAPDLNGDGLMDLVYRGTNGPQVAFQRACPNALPDPYYSPVRVYLPFLLSPK